MNAGGGSPWPERAADLIQWFGQRQAELPTIPFQLNGWTSVLDPAIFYAALGKDIACGPQSPRAAVLVGELEELFMWWARQRAEGGLPPGAT